MKFKHHAKSFFNMNVTKCTAQLNFVQVCTAQVCEQIQHCFDLMLRTVKLPVPA